MAAKKWVYLVLTSVLVVLIGCSKEVETPDEGIPSYIYIKVGEIYDLGEIGPWSSWNKFIATVWHNGKITGQHVGTCTINCPYDERRCKVVVEPNVTLFRDPITRWGMDKGDVISREGNDYQMDSETGIITYNTENHIAPYVGYKFTNNKLTMTLLFISSTYKEDAYKHLEERYKFAYNQDGSYVFIDRDTYNEASTIVILKYYNSSYWGVIYSPK